MKLIELLLTAIDRQRTKSVIRSSSGSYPYPRTHTTLMVIPTTRVKPNEELNQSSPATTSALNNYAKKTQPHPIRRRPPLNRAIPTIPESRSNESIMSHASRKSDVKETTPGDLVIENRSIIESYQRLDANSNIQMGDDEKKSKKTRIKVSSSSPTPKSPLMSVAHHVKSKLTKITQIGRNQGQQPIKTSQSFSGSIRPPTKLKTKRIDENANRVIKSSSMDVGEASTSRQTLVIPQRTTPLIDDKIEEVSECGLVPKSELADRVRVQLKEDVLVVTKEFDQQYPGQKRSASPDPPIVEKAKEEEPEKKPQKVVITTTTIVREVIPEAQKVELPSPEKLCRAEEVEKTDCPRPIEYTTLNMITQKPIETRFILKTPEALRRNKTFSAGDKIKKVEIKEEAKPNVNNVDPEEEKNQERVVKSRSDMGMSTSQSEAKFVMVMKTPEALRRHHTFTIGDRPPSPDYPYIEDGEITEPLATVGPPAERRRKQEKKEEKMRKWLEYDKKPTKFVLTAPAVGEDAKCFKIGAREEKMRRSVSVESKKHSYLRRLQFELFRGRSCERKTERPNRRQKSLDERPTYVLKTTTPLVSRKYQTFAIVDQGKDGNAENIEMSYKTESKTTAPADFYSITATTPVAKRKSSPTQKIRREVSPPSNLSLSDHADHQAAPTIDDLTSPEEDIPMDTSVTPTSEKLTSPEPKCVKEEKKVLSSRSFKLLTPSFLRKPSKTNKPKKPKKPYYNQTWKPQPRYQQKDQVAPLAEGESTVVANSPMVENMPMTFEKWTRAERITNTTATIPEEEMDSNGNRQEIETQRHAHFNTTTTTTNQQDTGLIDDDILDQPMLVGDTFSHSSSIDCISNSCPPNQQKTATMVSSIVSIDRAEIDNNEKLGECQPIMEERTRSEDVDNGNRDIEEGIANIEDIKNQLARLNIIVNEMDQWRSEVERLKAENAELRRQISIRDSTIDELRASLVPTN